jgi:hypothetical protein
MHAEFVPFGTGFALTTEKGDGIEWFQMIERPSQDGQGRKWNLI